MESLEYQNLEQIFRDYMDDEYLSLLEYHRAYFKLEETEGVSFNKDQRIVIVGYDISQEIRQTALHLRNKGVKVTCVEFSYFQTDSKEQLMSVDIVIGREPVTKGPISTDSRPRTDKKKFLSDLDDAGHPLFEALLAAAEENELPIHWGSVGFSLNATIQGRHVALLFGFPLSSAYSQTIYTNFPSIRKKVKDGEKMVESFKDKLAKTGLFAPAGSEMKFVVRQKPTEEQVENLLKLIIEFAEEVREKGFIG